MAAINIPGVGEKLGVEYTRVVTFGGSSNADVHLSSTILSTVGGAVALININEPNVFVKNMQLQVAAKLTTSTGTFTIGDSDDADGYFTDTAIVGTSTAANFNDMSTAGGYGMGKRYTLSHVINVTKAGAAASVISANSVAKVRVTYVRGVADSLNANT